VAKTRTGRLAEPQPRSIAPTIRPEWFVGNREQQLARSLGITQFGVNHVVLEPGACSSLRHWHEAEDEFILVLEGELVLHDDNGEHRLSAGMCAAFPAGEPNAHHLCNKGNASARLLAIGTRHRGREVVHYPDDGLGQREIMRNARGDRIS
jgi:uncharacterized cupin superfamily protein